MELLTDKIFSIICSAIKPYIEQGARMGAIKIKKKVLEENIKKYLINKYRTKEFFDSLYSFLEENKIIQEFIKQSYNPDLKECNNHIVMINNIYNEFAHKYPEYNIHEKEIKEILSELYNDIFYDFNKLKSDDAKAVLNISRKERHEEYQDIRQKECAVDKNNSENSLSNKYQSAEVMERVKTYKDVFVKPSCFKELLNYLNEDKPLILIGDYGKGKLLTSNFLAYELKDDYKITFIDGASIDGCEKVRKLIQSLNDTADKKEIIVFNNFLGTRKLNISNGYLYLIQDLIRTIKDYSCKKAIFNSRKTIFEDAKRFEVDLERYLTIDSNVFDRDNWYEAEERAYILRNYIIKNDISNKIEKLVSDTKVLTNIIMHENFNPLIIDRATAICKTKDSEEVGETILSLLNNPQELWVKEFSALDSNALDYLFVLYSLSDTFIKKEIVDECYIEFKNKNKIRQEKSLEDTTKVLDALIVYDNEGNIKFRHPSVIDYLENKKVSDEVKDKLILGAVYIEQIENIDDTREKIKELIYTPKDFLKLKTLPIIIFSKPINFVNYIYVKYIRYIYLLNIKDINLEDIILVCIEKIFTCQPMRIIFAADDILNIINMKYYNLDSILAYEEVIDFIYNFSSIEKAWELIKNILVKTEEECDFLKINKDIQDKILSKMEDLIQSEVENIIIKEFRDYLEDNIEYYEDYEYEDITNEIIDEIISDIDFEEIKADIIESARKHKIYNLDLDKIQYEYDYNYDEYIEEFAFKQIDECIADMAY